MRPGGGFVPNFQLFEKGDVNGEKEQKFYTFLKVSGQPPVQEPLCPAAAGSAQGSSPCGDKACATLPCPQGISRGLCRPSDLIS